MKFLIKILSTCAYSGYVPRAPGTAGSLFALVLIGLLTWFFSGIGPILTIVIALISTAGGVYISGRAACEIFEREDPPQVVIDEFAGIAIALILLPFRPDPLTIFLYVFAFALFRFLDIKKPLFIDDWQKFPGGWGIMADDVAAGILTLGAVQLIRLVSDLLIL